MERVYFMIMKSEDCSTSSNSYAINEYLLNFKYRCPDMMIYLNGSSLRAWFVQLMDFVQNEVVDCGCLPMIAATLWDIKVSKHMSIC